MLVAVKTLHKKRNAVSQVAFLRREMAALKELHHENIVEWFHTLETTTDIYAVFEFCIGGTLVDYLKKNTHGLSEAESKFVFVQILSALLYMHSKSMF